MIRRYVYLSTEIPMKRMIRKIYLLLIPLISFTISYCSAQTTVPEFQYVLDSVYKTNPEAEGIIVCVESPDRHISWTSSAGYADKSTKQQLMPGQPLLIASNTKTYVAAAILKLVENGGITIDQPIAGLITPETEKLLTQNNYKVKQLTIRHLLSHTSGIRDYVDDNYFEFVNNNPAHQWTREEQIVLSMKLGGPLAEPGKEFKYADINYLLLTEIIEGRSGKPFYTAIRRLLGFNRLGLNQTWFANLEPKPAAVLASAHQYWDKYKWDSYNLNPSWDLYGGGGLIATAGDMVKFFQYLFEGKIITDKALLTEMHSYVLPKEVSNYCLGIRTISFAGYTAFYHGGFWGTDIMYLPELNTTISVCILEKSKRDLNALISEKLISLLVAKPG